MTYLNKPANIVWHKCVKGGGGICTFQRLIFFLEQLPDRLFVNNIIFFFGMFGIFLIWGEDKVCILLQLISFIFIFLPKIFKNKNKT